MPPSKAAARVKMLVLGIPGNYAAQPQHRRCQQHHPWITEQLANHLLAYILIGTRRGSQ